MSKSFPFRATGGAKRDPLANSGLGRKEQGSGSAPLPVSDPLRRKPRNPLRSGGDASQLPRNDKRASVFLGNDTPKARRASLPVSPVVDDEVVELVDDEDFSSSLTEGSVLEWTDDDSFDEADEAGSEGLRDYERKPSKKRRKSRMQLNSRDAEIVDLLCRYKFAYRRQIERHFGVKNLSRRLTQLSRAGLIRNEKITESAAVWTATQNGIDYVERTVQPLSYGRISPVTLSHTIGLVKLGSDFERGDKNANIFGVGWPFMWKRVPQLDGSYELERGETVLTERIITQSYNRTKAIQGLDWMVEEFKKALAWKPPVGAQGNDLFGPEALEGNEWMFVGLPPFKAHVPDMVLVRPRTVQGAVQHYAIELELNAKKISSLKEILVSFKSNEMFEKVVYFTHKRQVVNDLVNVDQNYVGLGDKLLMKRYIPESKNARWG